MKRFFVIATVVASFLAISGSVFAQADPRIGTWKPNVAQSTYDPGPPPKSSSTLLIVEAAGTGEKVTTRSVAADGSRVEWVYTCNFDGKDCPATGTGTPQGADAVSRKQIDANTTETTFKKRGKALYTARMTVSKDGKTLTIASKGKNASGQDFNNVVLYDKE